MGRILAIDYGRKRTGIAVTDTLKIVATALATIPTHTLIDWLKKYIASEPVELIVVGEPKRLDNTPSESMQYIKPFLKHLAKEIPDIPVVMWDERSSTVTAIGYMNDVNKRGKKRKEVLDSAAAAVILDSYLAYRRNHPDNV